MAIEQWLVTEPKTIDLATVRAVRANLLGGSLNLIASEGPGARVEVTSVTGRDLKVAIDGDTLVIDHPQLTTADLKGSARTLWEGTSAADISVSVPASAPIKVRASSAEVLVSGASAAVTVTTVNGDQFLDGVTGPARLTATGGEISVRGHRGAITARTVSGDLVLEGAIDNAELLTVSGEAIVDVSGTLPDHVSLQSATGSLTLRLPEDATPEYQLNTVLATADLDDVRIPAQHGRTWRSPKTSYAKELTSVRVSTFSGRISVVRGSDTRAGQAALADRQPIGQLDATLDQDMDERLRRAGERLEEGSQSSETPASVDAGWGAPPAPGAEQQAQPSQSLPGQPLADEASADTPIFGDVAAEAAQQEQTGQQETDARQEPDYGIPQHDQTTNDSRPQGTEEHDGTEGARA
ncbi:hypothetical protein USB125703_00581 [Pseudoclavibacter triregionum]|nr:hypothetical protein USB125703_00581 [Pseudoclavibacter triregionum]